MSRMEASEKRRIVEALILSSTEPISADKLAEIIPYCDAGQAKDLVNELNTEYVEQDRSFEIWEVAGGFQIRTRAEFSGYLQKLQKERALRLSQAALETLAIIAYRQPTTRAEIEDVRGVDAGATVKSLLERHLIRIAGQREVPGRPMVYATTRRFLEVFGLERLKDLPTLRELDELAREQGLLDKNTDAEENSGATDAAGSGAGTGLLTSIDGGLLTSDDQPNESEASEESGASEEADETLEIDAAAADVETDFDTEVDTYTEVDADVATAAEHVTAAEDAASVEVEGESEMPEAEEADEPSDPVATP